MKVSDFPFEVVKGMLTIIFKDGSPGLIHNINRGGQRVKQAAWVAAASMAPLVENFAKLNAPWTDRTGNARNGLAARPFRDGDTIGIVIYHQVSYGIWLEVKWDGKYGIINPTIDAMGPQVMRRFDRLLERL